MVVEPAHARGSLFARTAARALWVGFGAAAYALLSSPTQPDESPVVERSGVVVRAPILPATPEPANQLQPDVSGAVAAAVVEPADGAIPPPGVAAAPVVASQVLDAEPNAPEPSSATPSPAAADAPLFVLPRMPGSNQLGASQKYDAEKAAWILTRAYEMPASRELVGTFYRKALQDLDMEVTEGIGPPLPDGSVRSFVKGRRDGAAAQVTARQLPGELDTRVRVIWREWQ